MGTEDTIYDTSVTGDTFFCLLRCSSNLKLCFLELPTIYNITLAVL